MGALVVGLLLAGVAAPAAAAGRTFSGRVFSITTNQGLAAMRVEIVAVNADGSFGTVLLSATTADDPVDPGRFVLDLPAEKPAGRAAMRVVDPAGRYMPSYDNWGRTYPAPYELLGGGVWDALYSTYGPWQETSFAMLAAGRYVPVVPRRVVDTRVNGHGPMQRNEWYKFPMPALPGEPVAFVLNVTATRTQCAADYIAVGMNIVGYETGAESSIVNARAGADVANLTTIRVGTRYEDPADWVQLYNHACPTDVVVDLQGYYDSGSPSGAGYVPVTPERVLDSRTDGGPLDAGEARRVDLAELATDMPADAVAVAVNLTATRTTAATSYLSAYPTGFTAARSTSVLNARRGQDVANLAVVPLAEDGSIEIYNDAGRTDVVVDVQGWYTESGGVSFYPLDHRRLTTGDGLLGAGKERLVGAPGRGIEIPADAQALAVNLTSTAGTAPTSYVTAYPAGASRPFASNLNTRQGIDLANSAVVGLGPGGHVLYNDAGSVRLLEDVQGYFAPGPLD
ncbi:hypothetical protein [Cellulomonas algicola]|uniref:hypothetical protein n=1 Tax=Cellulomonas algicola TaxID=2071633 RepID=UPI000F574F0E|nr:hypothetical protein [Cellulomonas algicola]